MTALAETGSVRALARGGREVTSIKARAVIPGATAKPGRLGARVRALGLERDRIAAERAQADRRRGELAGLTPEPSFPRWGRHPGSRDAIPGCAFAGRLIASELVRLDDRVSQLDVALEDVRRRFAAAEIEAAQGTPAEIEGLSRAQVEILVRLDAAQAPLLALEIDYVVASARWWPAYTARFTAGATRVAFAIDAFVAQASGEAWSGVALAISTADLASDVRLPELRSLRIGRAQAAPRKGYRPPPAGLDAMFEGYDRAAAQLEFRRNARRGTPRCHLALRPRRAGRGHLQGAASRRADELRSAAGASARGCTGTARDGARAQQRHANADGRCAAVDAIAEIERARIDDLR